MSLAFDVLLVLLLLGTAVWSVSAREARGAIIAFIACGVLLSLGWMRLGAPDVALTEAAVGAGLTGMLLLAATRDSGVEAPPARQAEDSTATPARPTRILGGLLCAALSVALAALVIGLPKPAPSLGPEVARSLDRLGLGNPVNGVLLGFRGLDTLIEKVVLLLALVAAWSLAPDRAWGRRPFVTAALRDGPLVLLGRVLPPIGMVVALYLLWNGATEPGGAFSASTVVAAMWLLVMLAGLRPAPRLARSWLRGGLALGPLLFFAVGLAGMVMADGFLSFPEAIAKPTIVVLEVALVLSVAMTLALLFLGPPVAEAAEDSL